VAFSVIIPSKTDANLGACVRAIRTAGETCRVIVVDDFEGEKRFLLSCDEPVDWQEGVKPFIFARNMNIGIRAAGDDDVILLNDDALLQKPHGFTAMQRAGKAALGMYGVISAVTNLAGNPAQQPQRSPPGTIRNEPRTVAFVCVLISRLAIKSVGLLDERFTAYGWEDNDYCRRVRNAGGKIGIFDGCFVDHGSLRSTFRGNPRAAGDIAAGAEIYRSKWGDLS
jgi:glycosyltransferase involved in cell wall biosynthesis